MTSGINASGTVAGTTSQTVAWTYSGGTFTTLPLPPGTRGVRVSAINTRGDVVGTVTVQTGGQAALWPASAPGAVKLLATPASHTSDAVSITDDGVVIGDLDPPAPTTRRPATRYIWDADGSGRALKLPLRRQPGKIVSANGNWVLDGIGFRWNLHTGESGLLDFTKARFIDRYGRVFGEDDTWAPAVMVNGTMVNLPMPPAMPKGLIFVVTPDGRHILGWIQNDVGTVSQRTLWTCD